MVTRYGERRIGVPIIEMPVQEDLSIANRIMPENDYIILFQSFNSSMRDMWLSSRKCF
jgi:hypothetical protein